MSTSGDDNSNNGSPRPQVMEIDPGRKRRWIGTVTYVLLYLAVAAVLFILLLQFTASLALAWGLVVFMVGYMAIMGWLAGRNSDGRNR